MGHTLDARGSELTCSGPVPGEPVSTLGQFDLGRLGYTAQEWFLAGTATAYPEQLGNGIGPHRPARLCYVTWPDPPPDPTLDTEGQPTDVPRPQIQVRNLTGFSNGFGPIVGTVPDTQLWGADFGVIR